MLDEVWLGWVARVEDRAQDSDTLDLLRSHVELPAGEDVGAVVPDVLDHEGHVWLRGLVLLEGLSAVLGKLAQLPSFVSDGKMVREVSCVHTCLGQPVPLLMSQLTVSDWSLKSGVNTWSTN